jgi:uncharacterized protein (DUF2141 family)
VRLITVFVLAVWANVAQSADISVGVQNSPTQGVMVFQIYGSANTFGDFRDPVREVRSDVRPDSVYLIEDIPAGEIAMLVYVDENENGRIDKNFIGIPKEALGISNDYRPKGPPAFDKARFAISEEETLSIDIALYKVLGERSRLGLRYEIPGGVNFLLRYEHDVLDNIGGGSATARISKGFQAGWLRFSPQLQVNWLSADLTNHDFGVAAEEVTFIRPAYDTGSSVSYEAGISSFIELTEDWRIFLSVSANSYRMELPTVRLLRMIKCSKASLRSPTFFETRT